jgi:hypothetical protein
VEIKHILFDFFEMFSNNVFETHVKSFNILLIIKKLVDISLERIVVIIKSRSTTGILVCVFMKNTIINTKI